MAEASENQVSLRVRTNSSLLSAASIHDSFLSDEDNKVDIDNDDFLLYKADDIYPEETYQEARSMLIRYRTYIYPNDRIAEVDCIHEKEKFLIWSLRHAPVGSDN